jgi:hypothetical protein
VIITQQESARELESSYVHLFALTDDQNDSRSDVIVTGFGGSKVTQTKRVLLHELIVASFHFLRRENGDRFCNRDEYSYVECIKIIHSYFTGKHKSAPIYEFEEDHSIHFIVFSHVLYDLQEHLYNMKHSGYSKYFAKNRQTRSDQDTEDMNRIMKQVGITCEQFEQKLPGVGKMKDIMRHFNRLRALYAFYDPNIIISTNRTVAIPSKELLQELYKFVEACEKGVMTEKLYKWQYGPIDFDIMENQWEKLRTAKYDDDDIGARYKQWEKHVKGGRSPEQVVKMVCEAFSLPLVENGITCTAQIFNVLKDFFKVRVHDHSKRADDIWRIKAVKWTISNCPEIVKLVREIVKEDGRLHSFKPQNNPLYGAMYQLFIKF